MSRKYISLGELVDIKGGGTPSRAVQSYWDGNIPWASVKDLKGFILSSTQEHISSEGLSDSASNLIPAGNVIVATRMGLGKVAINSVDVAINQDLKAIICKCYLDSRFLLHFLHTKAAFLEAQGKGATVKGITLDTIKDLQVPAISLSEQKRIAAILDKADAIRRKREKAIELTDSFLRSVFLEMFGDPESNPNGFDRGTIRDLVSEVKYGTSGKAGSDGKFEILRMNNLTYEGDMDLRSLKRIDLDSKDESKYLTRKGDILFNRTNSKELVGKTAVYPFEKPRAIAGYLIRVRPNQRANNEYIAAYLNSTHGKKTLRHMCKSIVGMANINAQELQDISILLPPLELQNKFAEVVKSARELRVKSNKFLSNSELLNASLSQGLFSQITNRSIAVEQAMVTHAL